jgi:cytochrome c biogenesis protein CcdA
MTLFLFAFLAGVVTIAGPCILPLLPVVLGTATVKTHRARPLFIVLGFTLAFAAFALIFSFFGSFLGFSPDAFRTLAAVLIGLFGLVMVFPTLQERLFNGLGPLISKVLPKSGRSEGGLWSGFLLGASLGLVWSPCAGPVLGSILTLVASRRDLALAGALLFAYALGAGLPMLAIAYGGQAVTTRVRALSKYTPTIQRVFGALIILVAIALYTGLDRSFQAYLVTQYPWLFPNLNLNL